VNEADGALAELLGRLKALDYDFVTVTPETHARVVGRPERQRAGDLRDVFGWSLPFERGDIPADIFALLERADASQEGEGGYTSRHRVSRVGAHLFLHSAYPTDGKDAVFLGPDTYRFVRFLKQALAGRGPFERLVDMGAGSGAAAICAAALLPGTRLTLIDTNSEALRLARINAAAAGIEVETVEGGSLDAVEGDFDLLIANPPYIVDEAGRAYRDGGGMHGAELALDWALAGAARAATVLLYTGSAIVGGEDGLKAALKRELGDRLDYRELDPDVFGEELDGPAYREVERIAAIGAVISPRSP